MPFDRCSGERTIPLADLLAESGARAIVTDGTRFAIDGVRLARVAAADCVLFLARGAAGDHDVDVDLVVGADDRGVAAKTRFIICLKRASSRSASN